MTEIKVQVDDELLATVSRQQLENFLQDMIEQLRMKAAAADALDGLAGIDISNDPAWKQAREEAWHRHMQTSR